jgi:hypothetical protein
MSILRNLLKAAQQAGPDAVGALKQQLRAAGAPPRQLLDAARSVGITLQQSGNPAGRAILDVVSPGLSQSVGRTLSASPAPTASRAATTFQPNLPNPRGPRGQFESIYGEPKAVIDARRRMAVPVEPSPRRAPAVSPGQIPIDSLGYSEPTGPLGRALLQKDPGTYQSIADMARRASDEYGVPVLPEDLLGAQNMPSRLLGESARGGGLVPVPGPMGARRQIPGSTQMPGVRIGNSSQPWGERPIRPTQVVDLGGTPRLNRGATAAAPTQEEVLQTGARNAMGGTRQADLSNLYKMLGAGAAGGLGLGAVAYNTFGGGGRSGADQEPSFTPIPSEILASPRTVEELRRQYLDAFGTAAGLVEGSSAYDPRTSATGGTPGQTAPSVIRINDADSNQRQATANALAASTMRPDAPSSYASIADYYQNRGAYAAQPGVAGNVIEQLIQVDSRFDRPEMQAWAASNPGLAYELLQNQQMPNVQQAEITTELGSNTDNNAIGNSQEAARVAIDGVDPAIRDATRPRMAVSLQPYFYNRPGFAGRI